MAKTKTQKLADTVIEYLDSKSQLDSLPELIKELTKQAENKGILNAAIVTSATKLPEETLKAITSYIVGTFGNDYHIVEKLDPSLIAGFTIKVGDRVLDSSLSSKLENIRKEIVWTNPN